MRQEFWIETIPQGQGRPKFRRFDKFVSTYDPSKSRGYKLDIKYQVMDKPHEMMEGALTMVLEFHMKRPKAHFTPKGLLRIGAPVWHTGKPDLDNLEKAVKDALTGILYKDDGQVCFVTKQKFYGDKVGVNIVVQNTI